ncbi:calcium/manganese antiporter SLC30A10 isoform X2 [Pantherophis guttatus]|uniref:Calcium/manganese antiporter SLC30A10 isoform X2 n=1 Tax=Pantherophis guttatus TaxID=94885 RepID=A0A6P9CLG1_PANGU|nr:calcium/manganese antiporter SLC30A10 isoform X2 [Pantherophis guttatus]
MGRYTGRSSRLLFMSFVTFLLFVVEMAVSYVGNSLALASDGFAVLSHLISMIIGLLGVRFSRIRWHKSNTYGFLRADVVGAFGNSVFATALMFSILIEAVKRFLNPVKTEQALYVLIVGVVGLLFNVFSYVIFMDCCYCRGSVDQDVETGDSADTQKKPEEDKKQKTEKKSEALNIRGVLLHVMGDALGSVIVVVAASIFYILPLDENTPCNWQCYIDPSLTIVMVFIILSSAFPLIKETATILLQMVPQNVNMQILANKLLEVPGVSSIHELHIWEFIKGKNIATVHVKCHSTSDYPVASYKMREVFHEEGIHSVTIQPEYLDHDCPKVLCSTPCISRSCDPQLCCNQKDALLSQMNGYSETIGSFSPSLKKVFQKKDAIEIPVEPTWAEDVVKKNSCSKDSYKEKSETMPQINNTKF